MVLFQRMSRAIQRRKGQYIAKQRQVAFKIFSSRIDTVEIISI